MKNTSLRFLLCLSISATIATAFVGCSRSENESQKKQQSASAIDEVLGLAPPTSQDLAFAKAHEATWITTNSPMANSGFTVDFQDGLFSEGSTLACALWVNDVQRKNGVLLLTGNASLMPGKDGKLEVEITTNMMTTIRAGLGTFTFIRLAFQVQSFNRIEDESSNDSDSSSDRYLIRGKATAVELIPEDELEQK